MDEKLIQNNEELNKGKNINDTIGNIIPSTLNNDHLTIIPVSTTTSPISLSSIDALQDNDNSFIQLPSSKSVPQSILPQSRIKDNSEDSKNNDIPFSSIDQSLSLLLKDFKKPGNDLNLYMIFIFFLQKIKKIISSF